MEQVSKFLAILRSFSLGPLVDIFVDEEIDNSLFCRYQDKKKNMFNDRLLVCDDKIKSNNINIYGEDEEDIGEIC